ncbi:hypothetical protein ABIC10_007204 [Bradyrhizobium sp. S3.2.12]
MDQIRFKTGFGEAVLGVMEPLVLSGAACERIAPLIIGRPDQKGATGQRQLEARRRCAVEAAHGLEAMSDDSDFEYLIIDSTIACTHQRRCRAEKRWSEDQTLGRSRGGLSTKRHLVGAAEDIADGACGRSGASAWSG